MPASGLQMNVRNCTFTPVGGGTAVTFTKVKSVSFDGGGSIIKFSGDGDRFNTTVVNDFSDPSVTISLSNKSQATTYGIGTRGTLTWTEKDCRNQAVGSGSGDMIWTMTTAVIETSSGEQQHRQFGTASIKFASESIDGVTPPLSLTVTS